MTGYGRGAAERGGRRATVEIRAVNHRFLDVKLRGAALDGATEEQLTARIREALDRGAITATIHLERRGPAAVRYDAAAAKAAHAALTALAHDLGSAPPDLALVAMRATEGAALARDLDARLATLAAHVAGIAARGAAQPAEARRRLEERLRRLLEGDGREPMRELDPARLAQEVAILADKVDVTEELVRAQSHLAQMRGLINGGAAVEKGGIGRRLDFLVQELGRELNTIGAKSQAPEIIDLVVRSKAELEKVREQVQNVE